MNGELTSERMGYILGERFTEQLYFYPYETVWFEWWYPP
jgi:hypothetical protein